jgi:pimeloyl-ACP methyl ester carboxylesterase
VFEKLSATWKVEPSFELSEIGKLAMPVLVMLGDRDMVTVEHAAAVQRAITDAQLAVVPGAGHEFPMVAPELVSRPVLAFLSESS